MKRLLVINNILFLIIAVAVVISFGSSFFIPFIFGAFLASLMVPFSKFLEGIYNNRIFSSLVSTLVIFIVVGALLYLFTYQLSQFVKDLPGLTDKIRSLISNIQDRIVAATGVSLEEQRNIIQQRSDELLKIAQGTITNFLSNILSTIIDFLFTLIYLFLFLHYRSRIYKFIMMYVDEQKKEEANLVIVKTGKVVYQYLWGRAQVMTLLGIMYYITFLIFGLPYAVLLSLFGALITIIPYIGPFISTVFPIVFAILYIQDSFILLLFIVLISIIQLVESYVLEPLIIGKEVKLNPLIVIVAVLIGGKFWGLAGMVLFVPLFAIIKIISNHTMGLKPVGYLFGISSR